MNTRCKPGDLAIITYARYSPQLLGHIVEVVREYTEYHRLLADPSALRSAVVWEVRYPDGRLIPQSHNFGAYFTDEPSRAMNDYCLTPIRDTPGQDETLTWKPLTQPKENA
jgi:hypothetical protein